MNAYSLYFLGRSLIRYEDSSVFFPRCSLFRRRGVDTSTQAVLAEINPKEDSGDA